MRKDDKVKAVMTYTEYSDFQIVSLSDAIGQLEEAKSEGKDDAGKDINSHGVFKPEADAILNLGKRYLGEETGPAPKKKD